MILLLTGYINPSGMSYTSLNNPKERERQYVNAIRYYLSKTNYPIVFTENSGSDISQLFTDSIKSGRMEYFTFNGNQDKARGKGYGECEIIEYALNNSAIINSAHDCQIAKITGRLRILNINSIIRIHRFISSKKSVLCAINSVLSFPDSRLFIAPIDFYRAFTKKKETINDSDGFFFEHTLCNVIKEEKSYPFSPFLLMPRIEGVSGSTGEVYNGETIKLSFAIKYVKYAFSQRIKFYKLYR